MKNFLTTVVSLSLLSGVAGLIAWIAGTSWGLTVLLVSVGVLLLFALVLGSITDAEEQAKLAAMSPEEREKYEAEKKEKIQQAEHQKHVKKSQNFSTADVKSVLRMLDNGSGWQFGAWCPICDAKLNYIGGYKVERVVSVAKPIKGVYVTTGRGAEVTEAVKIENESRSFGANVATCPYCEYTLYHAEAEDEVEDKRYLYRAISLGRLPKDKYDHIMKWDPEFKKENFDSPSDFIKKW